MATYAGGTIFAQALFGPLPGESRGFVGIPPPTRAAVDGYALGGLGAVATAPETLGDESPPTVVGGARPADFLGCGDLWFDHLHVLPRVPLDFGRVVQQEDLPFEVFSAQGREAVFSGASITPGQGLSIPDLPVVGTVVAPYGSLLDATSTPGAPVRLEIRAAAAGAVTIAAAVRFSLVPGGDAFLRAVGLRFELLPFAFEIGFTERLEWLTNVLPVSEGREQRIARREFPRQTFDVRFLLDGDERRRMQSLLLGAQGRAFGLPLWHERLRVTAAVAPAATSITVATTTDIDIRVGGYALLWKSASVYDVVLVESVSPTAVGISSALAPVNSYASGDVLIPLRVVRLSPFVRGRLNPVTLEELEVSCAVIDDAVGAPAGDLSSLATAYGRPLLDAPNVIFGDAVEEGFQTKVVIVDGSTGAVYQDQAWPKGKRQATFGFNVGSRAALYALRKILNGLRGRQTAVYVPTFFPDLRVVATLTNGTATMDVAELGYTVHVQSREPKATLRVTFTDGSQLLRRVLSSADIGGGIERLTLDQNWPSTKLASEVSLVEFLELCRLDSDEVSLEHLGIGRARATLPLTVVHDDP